MKPNASTPRRIDVSIVSTLIVQNSPVADRLRQERQVMLDVLGRGVVGGGHRKLLERIVSRE